MSDNLTTLISKVQAVLGDDGTIFTTATVTAAIRQALSEWNMRAPIHAADLIDGVTSQYEYELSDTVSGAILINDVMLQGRNGNEIDVPLDFDQYMEDERLFFRLRTPVTSADTLIVTYTKPHTIDGLDSATESTVPAFYNQAIIDGGAFFSIFFRATARVESINLSPNQSDNYRELAGAFGALFSGRMAHAARTRKPKVAEPDSRAWNDSYHAWGQ